MEPEGNRDDTIYESSGPFELRRPPFWSVGLVTMTAMVSLFLAEVGIDLLGELASEGGVQNTAQLKWLLLCVAVTGSFLARRASIRSRPLPPISFHDEYLQLPPNVSSANTSQIPYGDLLSISLGGYPPYQRVFVESRAGRLFHFGQESFVDPKGPERMFRELRRRIMGLPEGRSIIEAMGRRQTMAAQAFSQQPIATHALLGILLVFFVNQVLLGAFQTPFGQIGWGALSTPLIERGEYFRLFSANFLHGGGLHLLVNGIALWSLGGVMERLLGWPRFLVIYLLSGLCATTLSASFDRLTAVGASGAIFGLFGSLAVVNWRYRTSLPLGFRQPLRWWIIIIAINVGLTVMIPQIDMAAHGGGFVAGVIITLILVWRIRDLQPDQKAGPGLQSLAIGISIAFAASLAIAVTNAAEFDSDAQFEFMQIVAAHPNAQSGDLNAVAWTIAIDPDRTEALDLAEDAITRGLQQLPKSIALQDTLATVHHRQGKHTEAVNEQVLVLERALTGKDGEWLERLAPSVSAPVYASQLARFLVARDKAFPDTPKGAVSMQVFKPNGAKHHALRATLTQEMIQGALAYAVLSRTQKIIGLVRLALGPHHRVGNGKQGQPSPATYSYVVDAKTAVQLTGKETVRVLLIQPGPNETTQASSVAWKLWPMDREIAAYP